MANKITYNVGFNADTSGLDKLKQQLSSLQQYTLDDLLKVNTDATEADLQSLQKSIQAVSTALDQSYNFKLDSTNINTFNQQLKNSGVSIQQVAKDFGNAGVQGQIAFRNLATDLMTSNTQLKQTHSLLDSMATTLGNTIKWSLASGAINGITGSIQKAWGFTKSLDESLTNIRIVTGQSSDEMERFSKQAQKAAKSLGTATTDYTNAALIFYQQGLGDEDVAARAEVTIKAANVTGQSAAEVSEQLTAVWNGYKVVAAEAELYVDKLAAVAASTAADLEELSTGMSKVASAANTMGVNIDQLSAQLSTIVSVTRQDASLVGTALKTIYARMGDLKVSGLDEFGTSLGDVSGQMRQMGIEVLDQEGNLRDMGAVIEEVAKKWGTWTDAQQQAAAVAIAGKRQYNNLIALFENWDMYESALVTSQASAGTLQKQQDTYVDSLEGKLEQLGLAGEKVYNSLFDSDSMKDLIDGLTTATELLSKFIDAIGGGGQLLANFGSIALGIFKKHLAGGIATSITNLTAFRDNAMVIAGEIQMVELQQKTATEAQIPLFDTLLVSKQEQLRYAKVLTAEQKKQWDQQIQTLNAAQNEMVLAEQKEKQIKDELAAAQELLKTKKILTTLSGPEAKPKLLRAGEALTQSEFRERKNDAGTHYNAGSMTEFKEFNLETQEGRDAAINEIELRDNELAEQEKLANKTLQTVNTGGVEAEERVADISTYSEEVDAFTQGYAGNTEDITELVTLNEQLISAQAEYNAALQETLVIKQTLNTEETKLQELKDSGASEAEIQAQEAVVLEKNAQAAAADAKQKKALNTVNSKARKVVQEHTKVVQKNRQELEKTSKVIKNHTNNVKKANTETEVAKKKVSNVSAELKKFIKGIKIKAIADGIVSVVSGVAQLASAISTLTNLDDIFKDETTSKAEKFLAVVENLGMAIPMLIAGISGMVTPFVNLAAANAAANLQKEKQLLLSKKYETQQMKEAIATVLGITAEEVREDAINDTIKSMDRKQIATLKNILTDTGAAATNEVVAQSEKKKGAAAMWAGIQTFTAGIIAQIGWGPFLIIVTSIIAAIVGLIALIAWFCSDTETGLEKANKALEKEKENLAAVNEQYKQAQEELKKVQEAFDGLAEKQKIINDLQVGTEEWTKAVQENNQAVMDLVGQYSELASAVVVSDTGVMSLTQEGQDALEASLQDKTNKAYANTIVQQTRVMKAQQNVDSYEAGKAFGKGESYDFASKYDTDQLETILVKSESQEDLKQALIDNGMATESNAEAISEAMWAERDAIYENISSINRNSDAIKKMEAAYSASFFAEHEARQEADSIAAWDAMMGNTITQESEKIKGEVDDDEASDGKDEDQLDDTAAENYAKSLGVSKDELEYTDDGKVKVKGADDSTAISLESAVEQGKKYAGALEAEKQAEIITQRVNSMYAAAEAAGNSGLANLAGGQRSVTFDEATTTIGGMSGETLDASKDAIFAAMREDMGADATDDEIAKALGYDSYEDYELAFERTKKQAASTVSNIGAGNLNDAFDISNFTDSTVAQARTISDAFESVFQSAGDKGTEALNSMLSEFSSNPDTQAQIAAIADSIDWMDLNAENQFKAALADANIYVDESSEYWQNIVTSMEEAANVAGAVAHQYASLRSSLAEIKSLAGDLATGDIVSDEDYKKMIAYNSAAKDMFIQTADGYEFIGKSGKELQASLSSGFADLNSLTAKFGTLRASAANFEGKDYKLASGTTTNIDTAKDIANTAGYADMLASQGIQVDAFDKALALTQQEGIDTSSEEYKNAVATLESGIAAVIQAQSDYAAGLFDESQAIETWVSYNADSWDKAKAMLAEQGLSEDDAVYQKFAEKWKNTFISELGFGENYVSSLGVDELQNQLENIRKLELDYYADINNQIDAIGTQVDRAFGADKVNLLKQQVDLQNQSLQLAAEQAKLTASTFDTMFSDFLSDENMAALGVDATTLQNADGSMNLAAMNNLLATTTDEGTKTTIQTLIDMWGAMTDTAAQAAEAGWAVIDAQVEAFKAQHEGQIKVAEFSKEWAEFSRRFEKFTNYVQGAEGSLNVYGAESAADTIANSFAAYGDNKKLFQAQTNLLDEYPALVEQTATDYVAYQAKAAVEASAKATMNANYQSVLESQVDYSSAQQATKDAQAFSDNFEYLYDASQQMVDKAVAETAKEQANADAAQKKQNEAMAAARAGATADSSAMDDAKVKHAKAAEKLKSTDQSSKRFDERLEDTQEAQAKYFEEKRKYEEALAAAQQAAADAAKAETQAEVDAANAALAVAKQAEQEARDNQQALLDQYSEYGSTYEEISANLQNQVAAAAETEEAARQTMISTTNTYNSSVDSWEAAAQASQNAADTLAANNPYATVGADGSLLFDAQAFGDDWESALSSAQSTLEEMQGNLQAAYQGFIDAQGEMMELYDKEKNKLASINSILQSSADLWKIIGKNSSDYAKNLNGYYETMSVNSQKSYELSMAQLRTAQAEYDKVMASTDASDEMIQAVTDNLATASEAVMSTASEWMTAITTQFGEALNATFDTFVKNTTGYDLAGVTEEWGFATRKDEKYLDDVNATYSINNIERNFQKSIDATDSITAQKKLNSVMQEQLKILKEKDKLSQYDIDRANAMYELTLKQIALEEAQQTANKMKLTRDASGNYTYQYVADQDAIAQAEEELAAAENDLYNMDKDRNKELVDEYYSTMSEANSSIAEAIAAGDTARAERLRQHYFGPDGLLAGIQSELGVAEENLEAMGATLAGADWTSTFEEFTSAITESDLNTLAQGVDTLMSQTKASLDTVSTTINTLMTAKDSPLLTATNALQSSVKAATAIDTSKLMDATKDVLDKLPGLTADISALTKELDSYGDAYESWLKNNTGGMDANTQAINENSEQLIQANEYLGNIISGQGGSGTKIATTDNTDGTASQESN